MKKKVLLAVTCAWGVVCSAWAAEQGSVSGGDYVITVADGDMVTLNADDVAALGTSLNLVKKGAGRLDVAREIGSSWKGSVGVSNGYFRASNKSACGTCAMADSFGGIFVADGATFEWNTSETLTCQKMTLAGSGMNGEGALVGLRSGTIFNPGQLTLSAPATIAVTNSSSWTMVFNYSSKVYLNHHDLTLRGPGMVSFCTAANVFDAADVYMVDKGSFKLEQSPFGGNAESVFHFGPESRFTLARVRGGASKLVFNGTASFGGGTWSMFDDSYPNWNNYWNGPVELDGTLACSAATPTNTFSFNGPISGAGGFSVTKGYIRLNNPTNSFTGPVNVSGEGRLIASSFGALPALWNGTLTTAAGCTTVTAVQGEPALTDDNLLGLFKNYATQLLNDGITLEIPFPYTFAKDVETQTTIAHAAPNDFTLVGAQTGGAVALVNAGGTLVVTGAEKAHELASMEVRGGTVVFTNAGYVSFAPGISYVGAKYPDIARVVVADGSALYGIPSLKADNTIDEQSNNILLGCSRIAQTTPMRGIFEIGEGAIVSNQIASCAANAGPASAMGSVFVRGGALREPHQQNGATACGIGIRQQGYFRLDAGEVDFWQYAVWADVGGYANGYGVYEQNGGSYKTSRAGTTKHIGGNGSSVIRGGSYLSRDGYIIGRTLWGGTAASGGEGRVTIDGDAVFETQRQFQLGGVSNSVSMLNLNGGTLTCTFLQATTNNTIALGGSGANWPAEYGLDTARRYIYLNGGVLRKYSANGVFITPEMSRVTVGPRGAKFDANGLQATLPVNLVKPSGKGVASVPFSCDEAWRYIGSPFISIAGDGAGASAHAEFDPDTGTITGVTVTSPGNDYTTATATIQYGGWTQTVSLNLDDCLVENASDGGIELLGGGLYLEGTNTYEGVSRSRGGTLAFVKAEALPPKTVLECAGGNILLGDDRGTGSRFGSTLEGVRGTDAGGCISASELAVRNLYWNPTNAAPVAVSVDGGRNLSFPEGAKFVIEHPENVDLEMPSITVLTLAEGAAIIGVENLTVEGAPEVGVWRPFLSGTSLKFGPVRGTVLIFR